MPPINSDGFGSTGVNLCLMVRMSNCVAAMLRVHRYNQFFVAVRTQSDGGFEWPGRRVSVLLSSPITESYLSFQGVRPVCIGSVP